MCLTPGQAPDGQEIACRKCWQCLKDRQNDLVGRCIAESQSATQTWAVTLTYSGGENNLDAQHLNYADFQKFMKRLRRRGDKDGFTVRYLVAGEYGSKRGRAHWHAILFFYGGGLTEVWDAESRQRFEILVEDRFDWWPWTDHDKGRGVAYFQRPEYEDFAYAVKQIVEYTTKETATFNPVNRGLVQYTKQPPIGSPYFMELADRYVEQHLVPQSAQYSFPGQAGMMTDAKGKRKRRKYRLRGRMLELFLERFLKVWHETWDHDPPESELLERFEDKQARGLQDEPLTLAPEIQRKARLKHKQNDDFLPQLMVESGHWAFRDRAGLWVEWIPGKELRLWEDQYPGKVRKDIEQWLKDHENDLELRLELVGVTIELQRQLQADILRQRSNGPDHSA